ncbi:MAG: M28 family peptidase [Muribaculaceae bacterium]|nr:M28 family peptidase [Muribaculaceae bacterium]
MRMTLLYIVLAAIMAACGSTGTSTTSDTNSSDTATSAAQAIRKAFDGEGAYALTRQQCDFGPRVPGTPAHAKCAEWLESTLKGSCDTVMVQTGTVQTATEGKMGIKNIIGIINPEASQRLLLLAHWDTRPWADNDPDASNHSKPVMGANDGASGVGVLLQLASQLKAENPTIGVDIVLVDAEDMGEDDNEESWGLGTQYWVQHPHVKGYKPLFGILLDMVGASDATFTREYYSTQYAGGFVDLVWKCAAGSHFINAQGGAVTDDHVFVNRAGIPCVDIIDLRSDSPTGFCPEWHTINDTMGAIDPATLAQVGQTLLNVISSLEQ